MIEIEVELFADQFLFQRARSFGVSSSISASRSRTSSVSGVRANPARAPKVCRSSRQGSGFPLRTCSPCAKGRDGQGSGFVRGLIVDQNHLQAVALVGESRERALYDRRTSFRAGISTVTSQRFRSLSACSALRFETFPGAPRPPRQPKAVPPTATSRPPPGFPFNQPNRRYSFGRCVLWLAMLGIEIPAEDENAGQRQQEKNEAEPQPDVPPDEFVKSSIVVKIGGDGEAAIRARAEDSHVSQSRYLILHNSDDFRGQKCGRLTEPAALWDDSSAFGIRVKWKKARAFPRLGDLNALETRGTAE